MPVSMLMNREVVTLGPEFSAESAIQTMLEQGLSRMPVINDQGVLLGVFSKTDVVTESYQRGDTEEEPLPMVPGVTDAPSKGFHVHAAGPSVGDVMSRSPITVRDQDPVSRAAELMSTYQVHSLPVISLSGSLVGIISSLDILEWVAGLD